MKSSWKKFIFYLAIAAFCVYFAEALTFNWPAALLNPFMYAAYGLVAIPAYEILIRRGEKRFFAWYLWGLMVGVITETFVAKVTFFGLEPGTPTRWGIAWGAVFFVEVFFHPFFSFILPVMAVHRVAGVPLPYKTGRAHDWLIFAASLFYPMIVVTTTVVRGWSLNLYGGHFLISTGILLLILFLLSRASPIEDVTLSPEGRKKLYLWASVFFLAFLFITPQHQHGVQKFPPAGAIAGVTVFIGAVIGLLGRAVNGRQKPAPFTFRLRPLFAIGLLFWLLLIILGPPALNSPEIARVLKNTLVLSAPLLVIGSAGILIYSVFSVIKNAFFIKAADHENNDKH